MKKIETKKKKVTKSKTEVLPKVKVIEEIDEGDDTAEAELDPEVLSALSSKRNKKPKITDVDYIPELERDDTGLDFGDDN